MAPRTPGRPLDLLLIAGQIAAGKTSVAVELESKYGVKVVRARQALMKALGGTDWDRFELQRRGADLDARTAGRWLLDYLLEESGTEERWVLDAARTRRQTEPILSSILGSRLVYLEATEATRRLRYALGQAGDSVKRSTVFDHAMRHATESDAAALKSMAWLVIETDDLGVAQITDEIVRAIGWKPPS